MEWCVSPKVLRLSARRRVFLFISNISINPHGFHGDILTEVKSPLGIIRLMGSILLSSLLKKLTDFKKYVQILETSNRHFISLRFQGTLDDFDLKRPSVEPDNVAALNKHLLISGVPQVDFESLCDQHTRFAALSRTYRQPHRHTPTTTLRPPNPIKPAFCAASFLIAIFAF